MTWTLRLYDDTGTEIAWVTKTESDYSFAVTHPESGWDQLTEAIRRRKTLWPDSAGDSVGVERDAEFTLISDPAPLDLPPEEHLQAVGDDLLDRADVASTELTDE